MELPKTHPIFKAAKYGKTEEIETILAEDPSAATLTDLLQNTPLHYAINGDTVDALLKAGANPNARNKNGSTPAHFARSLEVISALTKVDIDLNLEDRNGFRPLHEAVMYVRDDEECIKAIECLLDHGADINAGAIMGGIGKTVLDLPLLFQSIPRKKVTDFLKENGALTSKELTLQNEEFTQLTALSNNDAPSADDVSYHAAQARKDTPERHEISDAEHDELLYPEENFRCH